MASFSAKLLPLMQLSMLLLLASSVLATEHELLRRHADPPAQAPKHHRHPPTYPPVKLPVPPVKPPMHPPVKPPTKPPVPPVKPPMHPPVKPPTKPPTTKPPVYPPVKPPTKPPVYPPVKPPTKPPVKPPVYPPVKPLPVAVRGVVYCNSCNYRGIKPKVAKLLQGALVKLRCNFGPKYKPLVQYTITDKNGYFYYLLKYVTSVDYRKCKVYLVKSASKKCSLPTNLNNGWKGADLVPNKKNNPHPFGPKYAVYNVGPFAFGPATNVKCPR